MASLIRQHARLTPRFSSPDEKLFCEKWLTTLEHNLYVRVIPMTAVADLIFFFLCSFYAHPTNVIYLRLAHVLHACCVLAAAFCFRRRPELSRWLGLLAGAAYLAGFGYVAYRCHAVVAEPFHEVMGATGLVSVSILYVQACGFHKRKTLLYAFFAIATATVSMSTSRVGPMWVGLFALLQLLAWYFHCVRVERIFHEARREYALRGKIAPAHIVRMSGGDAEDLQSVFEPKKRRSVCISSDWRNYQKLSEKLDPNQLRDALNGYYDICYGLLRQAFPRGNYYTDWIADELFIVVFVEENEDAKAVVNAAMHFAESLIRGKETFRSRYGLPAAIDVGVSTGSALIGMMGPEGFRKATALGDIPGRARRLQSAGKLLRSRLGEADRVVFDHDVLMQIVDAFDVKTFEAQAPLRLRDLACDSLFYVEPNGAPKTAAA
jgi:class 3 adenylate cyclase